VFSTLDWARVNRLLSPHHRVYLMVAPGRSQIKIGRTQGCVFTRRATLRTQLGTPIFVMAQVRARPPLESYLHQVFAPLRLEGEWFEEHEDLHALARRLNVLDIERFGPRPPHPDEVEMDPWIDVPGRSC